MSFNSWSDFTTAIWVGLKDPSLSKLRDDLRPFIERENVPVVFTHGDIAPWNLIFPGGLEKWKGGETRVVLIDWECAGWMPIYWDALKMAYLIFDKDDPHWDFVYALFPESREMVEADYEWRSRSRITII